MEDGISLLNDIDDEEWSQLFQTRRQKNKYQKNDPVTDWSDGTFKLTYRMTKESARELTSLIGPFMPKVSPIGRRPIALIMKLLITLQYLAGGNVMQATAFIHGCSLKTVCNVVGEVPGPSLICHQL